MMRVNSNRGVILRVRFIALLPLSSWSPPATRWRHKRYIRNLHQWGGVAFAAAAGARVLVFIGQGAKYVRRVMPESWGALGRRDGIVRCP